VEALIEDKSLAPASARDEYIHASADAIMKVCPGPFSSAQALTAWVNVAANRWRMQPVPISIAELFPFIEKHGGRDALRAAYRARARRDRARGSGVCRGDGRGGREVLDRIERQRLVDGGAVEVPLVTRPIV